MIYRLMKANHTGRIGLFVVPLLSVGLAGFSSLRFPIASIPMFVALIILLQALPGLSLGFLATLPVKPREVFLARFLSLTVLMCGPVLLVATVHPGRLDEFVPTIWKIGALCVAMTAVVEYVTVGTAGRLGRGPVMALTIAAATFGATLASDLGSPYPVAAACFAIAGVVTGAAWFLLPTSFRMPPPRSGDSQPREIDRVARKDVPHWQWWRPMLRSLFPWRRLFVLSFMVFVAYIQQGVNIILFAGLAVGGFQEQRRWIRSFPIRTRVWLPFILIPPILALYAGRMIAERTNLGSVLDNPIQSVYGKAHPCAMPDVVPPVYFWQPVTGNNAPRIQAPWGETADADVTNIPGLSAYNPWSVGCRNSQRFLDWQFARATVAVYGHALTRADFSGNRHVPYVRPPRIQVAEAALLATVVLAMALLGGVFEWRRLPVSHATRQILAVAPWVVVGAIAGLSAWAQISRHIDPGDLMVLIASWLLPAGLRAAIATTIVVVAVLYQLAVLILSDAEDTGLMKQVKPA